MMPLGLLGPGEQGEITAVKSHKATCCGGCGCSDGGCCGKK
jgi:hypothetical protein